MSRRLARVFMAIAFAQLAALLLWSALRHPRVFVVHSYDAGYSWVRDVNAGLVRVLGAQPHLQVKWHYLDTKRHPWPEYKVKAGTLARRIIDSWGPHLIIAVDDDAQEYVGRHYAGVPGVSVVFAGVNAGTSTYGYDRADNVCGILERLPLPALLESLQLIASDAARPPRVLFLGDRSETVAADARWVREFAWSPLRLVDTRLVGTFEEWKAAVEDSSGKADYLLTSDYRMITRAPDELDLVPPDELIAWTEQHAPIPVLGTSAFFVEDGGMLAIATSPGEQGEAAARMAVDILVNGRTPREVGTAPPRQFVVAMSATRVRARGLALPSLFEACARAADNFLP